MLIVGTSGQLGTAYRALLPDARYIDVDEFDLSRPGDLPAILDTLAPDGIINCAAYTAVDRAEEDEALATLINGDSVGVMAGWAGAAGVPFVTYSTDYVFPGDGSEPYVESSPTDPVNAYGRSKLVGEEAALAANPACLIIRTSWLVSGTHPNFVATMIKLAAERSLTVVDDQYGCPTMVDDLAATTLAAMDAGASGRLHLTNQGVTTWFEFARESVRLAGIDQDQIAPCSTDDYPTPARRPAYSVMASEHLVDLGLDPLPRWKDSLPAVVAGLKGDPA